MISRLLQKLRDLVRRITPSGNIYSRTVHSGLWETFQNVGGRLLQLLVLLVLARLLSPRDFGLMGIVLLVVAGLDRFSRLGVNQALIHRHEDDVDHYLDTAWVLQLVRGALIATLLFLGAPLVAGIFGESRVVPLLHLIAVSPLLLAVRNPGVVYFEKRLDFHLKFLFRMGGSIVEAVVAIGYALVSPDVLALVYGYLAADATRLLLSYWLQGYRPSVSFDLEKAGQLLGYGKWITANNVVNFFLEEGDDAAVGVFLSAQALGFYKIAYRVGTAPATEVTRTISNVVFSMYSKLQDDRDRLRNAFLQTLRLVGVLSFPMVIGIVAVAPVFVDVVLGDDWTPAITTMQILTVYGGVTALTVLFEQVWKAVGRPELVSKVSILQLALLAAAIYPAAVQFGIEGVAAVVAGVTVVTIPVRLYITASLLQLSYFEVARELVYPIVASLLMGALVLTVRQEFQPALRGLELVALIVLGGIAYLVLVTLLDSLFDWGITRNVRTLISTVRG
ncbi:lipopolysaccharide biosynthesis protein [Salinirubellus salinus]|uniref:Lipopolysaccharide biosynthesis protein n=1 Tax=Salinirubellus salinus TaxID=1364945 RepID=A0A9E7UB14_9EURY|nr:lipopolysaccharide biosynthesis protein [Salinirubellus salinus]UWM54364.1 lipopolysaccharide biosynthesis protein [Salinirubellus salinus]